jgi:hypothetical protein
MANYTLKLNDEELMEIIEALQSRRAKCRSLINKYPDWFWYNETIRGILQRTQDLLDVLGRVDRPDGDFINEEIN